MTDQHQPADVAPRLSDETEADYLERKWRDDAVSWSMAVEDLKEERDSLRADLARARAEAAEVRAECDEVRNLWLVRLRESTRLRTALEDAETSLDNHDECDRGRSPCEHDDDALRIIRAALAEPQPAVPVDRSAEASEEMAEHPWFIWLAPTASVHRRCCRLPQSRHPGVVNRLLGTGRLSIVGWEELLATTPPDHQAGDGDDADVR